MIQFTATQLKRALKIQRAIESLQTKVDSLTGKLAAVVGGNTATPHRVANKKKGISAAGRARIAAAQRARWTNMKGKGRMSKKGAKKMSAQTRAKMAAAAKARWAKAKAAGKNRL